MGSARGQGSSRQVKAKDCEVWGMGDIGGSYLTVGDGSKIGACATTVAKKISSWSVSPEPLFRHQLEPAEDSGSAERGGWLLPRTRPTPTRQHRHESCGSLPLRT